MMPSKLRIKKVSSDWSHEWFRSSTLPWIVKLDYGGVLVYSFYQTYKEAREVLATRPTWLDMSLNSAYSWRTRWHEIVEKIERNVKWT